MKGLNENGEQLVNAPDKRPTRGRAEWLRLTALFVLRKRD